MIVGLTSSFAPPREGSKRPKNAKSTYAYADAIRRDGVSVRGFLDEPAKNNDLAELGGFLDGLDALVLSGGADVDPTRYGGGVAELALAGKPQYARDAFEIAAVREAIARRIPTLCICRGMQLANVAIGGTLVVDIPTVLGLRAEAHHPRGADGANESYAILPEHVVALAPDSRVAAIVGTAHLATNSVHHQALREVAAGLRVVGRTDDGVIEAVEATFPHPFFVGVQWHPERTVAADAPSRAMFDALLAAAADQLAGSTTR
jgi:putative glutamine amidotransferase